jgi:hypothetical protein
MMLNKKRKHRASAADLLTHSWLTNPVRAKEIEVNKSV